MFNIYNTFTSKKALLTAGQSYAKRTYEGMSDDQAFIIDEYLSNNECMINYKKVVKSLLPFAPNAQKYYGVLINVSFADDPNDTWGFYHIKVEISIHWASAYNFEPCYTGHTFCHYYMFPK